MVRHIFIYFLTRKCEIYIWGECWFHLGFSLIICLQLLLKDNVLSVQAWPARCFLFPYLQLQRSCRYCCSQAATEWDGFPSLPFTSTWGQVPCYRRFLWAWVQQWSVRRDGATTEIQGVGSKSKRQWKGRKNHQALNSSKRRDLFSGFVGKVEFFGRLLCTKMNMCKAKVWDSGVKPSVYNKWYFKLSATYFVQLSSQSRFGKSNAVWMLI